MADTTFVNGTVIEAAWLNDANDLVYGLPNTSDAAQGDALVGVKTPITGAVASTQHQVNSERTSSFQTMTSSQITAISAEAGAAGAVCSDAMQTNLEGLAKISMPKGRYLLDKTLLVKNGTQRVTIIGDNRIRTILSPNAVSIAQAPANVNAVFNIQDNNGHFCLENIRFYSDVAYTGVGIYAVEGGGSDAGSQALFSSIMRNLWVDFSSTNTGFFTGALQNSIVDTVTAENMKGLFSFVGIGNADAIYQNLQLYNCYDHVVSQVTDTQGSFILTWRGIHAYTHNRGRLFDTQNWHACTVSDIILEPAVGNLGSTGLFKFKDFTALLVENFTAVARAGVPACAVGIDLLSSAAFTSSGKFSNGKINADVGLRLNGPGSFDIEFENVDFTDCATACWQIQTNCSGTIRTRGCKFNNSQLSILLSTASNALNWYSYDDEFLNAGLGGASGTRNLLLATSGAVVLQNPRIGRDDGGAAAAYFVDASGSGTVDIVNPIWIGTPPTGRVTGAQAVVIKMGQATSVTTVASGTYTVLAGDRDIITNFAGTVTLTLPAASDNPGRRLTIRTIQAQAVSSASSNVVPRTGGSAATAILAAVDGAWAELVSDGTSWQIMSSV